MSQHTKEPWPEFVSHIGLNEDYNLGMRDDFIALGEADYVRARACVNACAGISTEALEYGLVGAIDETRALLQTQRDELLAQRERLMIALERVANASIHSSESFDSMHMQAVAERALGDLKSNDYTSTIKQRDELLATMRHIAGAATDASISRHAIALGAEAAIAKAVQP